MEHFWLQNLSIYSLLEYIFRQKASFFEQRLIRWLLVNRNLFPQFISNTNQDTDLRPMFNNCSCITQWQTTCLGTCGTFRENGYNNSPTIEYNSPVLITRFGNSSTHAKKNMIFPAYSLCSLANNSSKVAGGIV